MTDTAVYIVTGILAVLAVLLFLRSGPSQSMTEQKQAEVKRKRAALISKRKAEAEATARATSQNSTQE